jgi:N-acyl-D-aspartate/D-glutamate deacylase
MAYDILIKGGRIYDGSGLPSYLGDVAVQDGRIVDTGRISGSASRVINADGLAISPGFIDFHTHLDAQLLWDPLATSSCFHGVTTVIPGNCALALAPCKEQDRETILRSFERVEAISLPALRAGVEMDDLPGVPESPARRARRQCRGVDGPLRATPIRYGRCRHRARGDPSRNSPDERSA